MPIPFNQIPLTLRTPGVLAEFDNSLATRGIGQKPFKGLIIAPKLSAGTATALVPVQVSEAVQARSLFGAGSIAHQMVEMFRKNNRYTELWVIPTADPGGGVADVRTIGFTGMTTAAGTLYFYVGGKRYTATLAAGSDPGDAADAIVAAIQADPDRQVNAANVADDLQLTHKHASVLGAAVDYRWNRNRGESFPPGIVADAEATSAAGAGVTDLAGAIAAMPDVQYEVIATPFVDTAALDALAAELEARWDASEAIDGHHFVGLDGNFGTVSAAGSARNQIHETMMVTNESPSPHWHFAAALAGQAAFHLANDPARPLQTLELVGIVAPAEADRFTNSERNLLLYDGCSTFRVTRDGTVVIERTITTYQTNAFGAADVSYLDVNTRFTLSLLRWSFVNRMLLKFPRHKLAGDDVPIRRGSAIVTPRILKAEAIALFREWEDLGLVEDLDQFKDDIIVERNSEDVNRVDFYLPPNLVNQFRLAAAQIGFRL